MEEEDAAAAAVVAAAPEIVGLSNIKENVRSGAVEESVGGETTFDYGAFGSPTIHVQKIRTEPERFSHLGHFVRR